MYIVYSGSNEEETPKEEKKISKLEDMQSPFDYKRFFRKYTIFAPFILVYFTLMFFVNSTVQNGTMVGTQNMRKKIK
ncbi:hypothetical protein PFMALIP_02661 [Plasmodium falciparum MaliPS096_E11]|uniref:Uncharacterized protein n=1 Tax=Plasmodium falciparum MaliPS096_E11 TaxID=1036727 RepID=A0A024WQ91_PLAFA|nr:hypothetical protein PFMALIP_02661 [Plasmodium falciparum MaliPS096_E11]